MAKDEELSDSDLISALKKCKSEYVEIYKEALENSEESPERKSRASKKASPKKSIAKKSPSKKSSKKKSKAKIEICEWCQKNNDECECANKCSQCGLKRSTKIAESES